MKLCERCGKKEATVQFQQSVNGKKESALLCESCAKELGLGFSFAQDPFFSFPLFASSVGKEWRGEEERCPHCHMSFFEIKKSGRFGCSTCYDTFRSRLDLSPFVGKGYEEKGKREISLTDEGKQGEKRQETKPEADPIAQWKEELKRAVAAEDYEKAAALRDRIRAAEER
jgi:protein arginine kinase activator